MPSVTMSYMVSPMSTLKFAYNMRINRPGIDYLNPFVNDSDPTNVSYGNPDLDTEKSHNLELSFSRFAQKFMINAGLDYSFTNNGIERYSVANGGIMTSTYGNVTKRNRVGLNVWCNWNPWPKTRLMLSFNGSYHSYKSQVLNSELDGFSGNLFANIQQTLPHQFTISAMAFGNTGHVEFQNKSKGMVSYGFNLSKSFFKDKSLTITLNAMSPFKKHIKIETNSVTNTYEQHSDIRVPIRRFGVSLSWRFGNLKASVKKTSRSIQNDDVMRQSSNSSGEAAGATGAGM